MSFMTEMMMIDQATKLRQKEEEDRQFELLKRQHEKAKLDEEAYMRPFEREEAEAQFRDSKIARQDAEKARNNKQEAERIDKWVQPYKPKLGVNDDGTRSMDIVTPMAPAIAGLMAGGMGVMGNDLEGFMKPFADQAIVNSRTYNTPEELIKKANLESEHKRKIELENTKAANRASNKSSKTGSGNKTSRQNPADTRFYRDLDAAAELEIGNFYKQNNKRLPTPEEQLIIKTEVAKKMLSHPLYSNVSPEVKQALSPQPAPPVTPQQQPAPQKMTPEQEAEIYKKQQEIKALANPQTQTVNLQEKQGAALPPPMGIYLRQGGFPESTGVSPMAPSQNVDYGFRQQDQTAIQLMEKRRQIEQELIAASAELSSMTDPSQSFRRAGSDSGTLDIMNKNVRVQGLQQELMQIDAAIRALKETGQEAIPSFTSDYITPYYSAAKKTVRDVVDNPFRSLFNAIAPGKANR